jgi:phthalate 4,5-dioxygenase
MTTQADGELLTRVGPGTLMGNFMREYWIPAAKSSELVADAPPTRLLLLGEKLVAFRDNADRVGVMDHRCAHRCASLFYGRNEEGGLRCIYHGWKFDVDGNCLDTPNVPTHHAFPQKVRARAYQVRERGGIIWVYMGARAQPPDLPFIEATLMPQDELNVFFVQRECSYLQALEGDIDTSHFGFLHAGGVDLSEVAMDQHARFGIANKAPEYHVAETDWGTMYAAYRPADPGTTYWRFAHFLFPFWTIPPDGDFKKHVITRAWVPMDDHHTMFVHIAWKKNTPGLRTLKDGRPVPGTELGNWGGALRPNDTGWYGRFRPQANADNDHLIDRAAQQNGNYSGIAGIHMQDQAMTESMGPVTDFEHEHLAVSDAMIARTRRRLALAARAHAEGMLAPMIENPEVCLGARGGDFISSSSLGWLQAYSEEMRISENPTGVLKAAE